MSNGFLSNGGGPKGARYGRCSETNRAFKADGTVRKARVTKSPEEQMAHIDSLERKAHANMGRKVLAPVAALAGFLAAFGTFRRWVRECKAHGSDEATAKRRASLEAQLATLDAKQEASEAFLAEQGDAIEQANGVFSEVGAAYAAFFKENKRGPTEDELSGIIAETIDADAIAAVQSASNPENDPHAEWRRDATEEAAEADEDDDTL